MPPSDNVNAEDFATFSEALAHTNPGGTIHFKDGGLIEEPVVLNKDVTIDAHGAKKGVSFTKKVTVNDADVTMNFCAIRGIDGLEVTGTKPFTLSNSTVDGPAPAVINTSGEVMIQTTNFWNQKGSKENAIVFGDKCGKVVMQRCNIQDAYTKGAVVINSGNDVRMNTVQCFNASPAIAPFIISGDVKGRVELTDFVVQYKGEATANTAIAQFSKTKLASEKEFADVSVEIRGVEATNNATFTEGRTKVTAESTGIAKAFIVMGVNNNIITSDNPVVTFK